MHDILEDHLQATLPASAPLLREALNDKDGRSAAAPRWCLCAGLETETALPVLTEKLWTESGGEREDDRFQGHVVRQLTSPSPASPAIAEAWCKGWHSGNAEVPRKILEPGLLVLQPEALPHLVEQLRQAKTDRERRDLARSLAGPGCGSGQAATCRSCREELRDPKPAAPSTAAASALSDIGPDAADAVPELLKLLNHTHPGMRVVAAQTLAQVWPGGEARRARSQDDVEGGRMRTCTSPPPTP